MKTDDEVKIVGRLKELATMASSMAGIKPGTPVKEEDEITQVENYLREIAVNLDFQKRQQTALYAATKVLAEAEDVGVAMPHILQAICEALHWQWAAMWRQRCAMPNCWLIHETVCAKRKPCSVSPRSPVPRLIWMRC